MTKRKYADSVIPTFKKLRGTTNVEVAGNQKSLWLLVYYKEKDNQDIQQSINNKADKFPRLKYRHTSSACLGMTKAGYLYYVSMFTIERKTKNV